MPAPPRQLGPLGDPRLPLPAPAAGAGGWRRVQPPLGACTPPPAKPVGPLGGPSPPPAAAGGGRGRWGTSQTATWCLHAGARSGQSQVPRSVLTMYVPVPVQLGTSHVKG